MSSVQTISGSQFLANLQASGLLSSRELAPYLEKLSGIADGSGVARVLTDLELLTSFQAKLLLNGRVQGFHLGPYRILEQLGRGGMGRVFQAEHLKLKRKVALKVLSTDLLSTERAQELFLREMRVVARLTHPNVVTAYDANELGGRYFLVLEYVNGPNLEQLVRQRGPLTPSLAAEYIWQTASGLQAAHSMGMVHRDLKPANILLHLGNNRSPSPGLIKVSDFGLARLLIPSGVGDENPVVETILARENTVMGTPDFLSPEQAKNLHKTDIRSDIYSLGCTFYFLLAGQVPFPGGKPVEKILRHFSEQPKPIIQYRTDLPKVIPRILEKMMAKRPADRYQDPFEVLTALEPFVLSGSIPWDSSSNASPTLIRKEESEEPILPEVLDELSELAQLDRRNSASPSSTRTPDFLEPSPGKIPPGK